jgi:hypothetical protein
MKNTIKQSVKKDLTFNDLNYGDVFKFRGQSAFGALVKIHWGGEDKYAVLTTGSVYSVESSVPVELLQPVGGIVEFEVV